MLLTQVQAEFSHKVKPKLPQQFASAEKNGVPFAVVLGEDEMKEGKVKIKEMGLPEGHAEKNGVDVELTKLVEEIKRRVSAKSAGKEGGLGVLVEDMAGAVLDGVKQSSTKK